MKPPIVNGNRIAEYTLRRAMLLYEAQHGDHYATLHPVTHNAGRASIGAGQALTESALRQALTRLGAPKGMGGWVAPEVLYLEEHCIVWTRRPGSRAVFFTEGAGVGATRGNIQHPRLVFAVTHGAWYVAAVPAVVRTETTTTRTTALTALDRFGRPTPGNPLAHAPYFNVYESGAICTGNVSLPPRLALDTLQGFEDAFFDSKFTHSNNPQMTTHPDGPVGLWRELLASTNDFPDHHLAPMGCTLQQFVARITKAKE